MELKDLDPAIASALSEQRTALEAGAAVAGAKGCFARLGLRVGENFQNALTGETLRRTQPEDIMDAVGRMAGYQMTTTALQFIHMVPPAQREQALFVMLQAMMSAAADYSHGMIGAYGADEAKGVHFTIKESGPVTVEGMGGFKPHG
ncbi:hypothetical protein [Ancylobacter sp. SL191]|uniref:hypothetical protein n=1 Tax=Ancylobacter sp. SL191 TaxID=2995166 RepID=UPI002271C750|nr:hypothetical protein [Ancylobacter sp. SL191]WAC26317.1 hypothetical protein OU996_15025 [Ancylobacter sp. SL191]